MGCCNQRIDGMGKPLHKLHEYDTVRSCDYKDLYTYNPVFNLNLLGPVMHVGIDLDVHASCRLLQIADTKTQAVVAPYEYDELGKPWVDIMVDLLDLSIGLHTYRLEFVNLNTGDTYYQYFNYTIQDDNPEQPYIYMQR